MDPYLCVVIGVAISLLGWIGKSLARIADALETKNFREQIKLENNKEVPMR